VKKEVIDVLRIESVVGIFHGLWQISAQWPTEEQTQSLQKESREHHFSVMLDANDEAKICNDLLSYAIRNMDDSEPDDARGMVLDLMYAIDGIFSQIHPRTQSPAGIIRPKPVNAWLKEYRSVRRNDGSYLETEIDRVIPRGPLAKIPRAKDAAYATNIEDCFSFICVVPVWYELKSRKIFTKMKVFSKSGINGVSKASRRPENISVMPIAEKSGDLSITCTTRNSQKFARYEAADPSAVLEHLIAMLSTENEPGPEIAVAPELLVDAKTADAVEARYGEITNPPQMFVCGTGHTEDMKKGQAWNESRVINAAGIELWRQRKIWPASINGASAINYNLTDPSPGHLHEDNCASSELIIADLDDLGRCIVMICQDFEATSLAEHVIRCYQPDWVFVPILDRSVDVGRWGHSRAFNLSTLSQARFIIVSSTALDDLYKITTKTQRKGVKSKPFALLIGPKVGEAEDSRVYRSIVITKAQKIRAAKLAWQPSDAQWKKTTLT
jgi:hypothetical protein